MNFNYKSYLEMLHYIGKCLPIVTFKEALKLDKFCVIRHDVEYSPLRALKLAKIEYEYGIKSSYCFQLRNNTYNILSKENLDIIREIHNLGHPIGAHIHFGDIQPTQLQASYILQDIETLHKYSGVDIEGWSIHRPKGEILSKYVEVDNKYINYNGKRFFQYYEGKKPNDLQVIYLADSNHQWKYGHPYDFNLNKINKLQLNCHPFSWGEKNLDNRENFFTLTQEKKVELVQSINNEIKNYPKDLYEKECYMVDRN